MPAESSSANSATSDSTPRQLLLLLLLLRFVALAVTSFLNISLVRVYRIID